VGEVSAVREVEAEDRVAGFNRAKKDRVLACLPECGWTFAKPAPKRDLTRSIANRW